MIICDSITKAYADEVVFRDFSYSFPDHGFVLLYGESGCGKTTLLNILAGLIPFDSGRILIGNVAYSQQVDKEQARNLIGYITQDSYFVDYLTVFDNLRLSSVCDEDIFHYLSDFGLDEQKDNYPRQLSGGERQRLAIVRALLNQKDILLLDEPTASLDAENKQSVFHALDALKQTKLIICSSHDSEAKAFSDQIIDFHNLQEYKVQHQLPEVLSSPAVNTEVSPKIRRKLFPFMKQWYQYSGKEKKSKIQLSIVFVLAIFALCLGDTPSNKLESNTEYVYKLNQLRVGCSSIAKPLLEDLEQNSSVYEVDLLYNRSAPDGIDPNSDSITSTVDYNLTAETLPYKAEAFRLSDKLAYGTYFTDVNQIILSPAMANKLGKPSSLIGQTYQVKMYGGTYDMKIVGVFSELSKTEKEYLRASGVVVPGVDEGGDDIFYINGKFTQQFINDTSFFMHGNREYVIYFRSFRDMNAYYDSMKGMELSSGGIQYIYADINIGIRFLFETMFYVLFPVSIVIMLISVLFYYQTQKTETVYNRHMFSVYQYVGYSIREIKSCWIIGNILELLKALLISSIIAIPLMLIINAVNYRLLIIPFQLFTFNIPLLVSLALLIFIISIVTSANTLRKLRIVGWHQILLEQRDLL